jgi:amino acid adenylation domain-containing protein
MSTALDPTLRTDVPHALNPPSPRPRTAVRVLLPADTDLERIGSAAAAALTAHTGVDTPAPVRAVVGSGAEAEALLRAQESGAAPAALLVEAPGRARLGLLFDTIVDRASAGWLLERIAAGYGGLPARTQPWPPAPAPAAAVSGLPSDEVLGELRAELVDLPLDVVLPRRPRAGATARFAVHELRLPSGLGAELGEQAAELAVPVESLLVGALLAVLHRYARQPALVIGVQRDRPCATAARGAVADLVPVPSVVTGTTTAGEIVAATAAALHRGEVRPAVAPGLLAELLGRPRVEPGAPLFGTVVTLVAPLPQPVLPEGRWSCTHLPLDAVAPDVELVAGHDGDDLVMALRYRADLFDPALIPALARHLVRVLAQLGDRSELPVHRLDLLAADEIETLCTAFSAAPDPWPPRETLDRTVARHAREHGALPAVVEDGGSVSYAGLDAMAQAVAGALITAGIGHGDVVALAAGRGAGWVATLLGAGRLGAALLPLDPQLPPHRMRVVAEQVGARLLLHDGSLPPGTADGIGRPALPLVAALAAAPRDVHRGGLGDLAFLMQTSGSTGVPKIVMGQQKVLAHIGSSFAGITRLRRGEHASWMTPTGFGTTLAEIGQALVAGAALHPAPGGILTSAPVLRDWLLEHRIAVCFAVTQVGDALQWQDWPASTPLRVLIMGGEKLHHWGPADLPFEVAVGYGCHEALFVANPLHPWEERLTASRATAQDRLGPPPIGRPNPGVRLHVLGEHGELMPLGSIGEIWFDSPEAALGYWADPAQTADRFRPDPYGPPGARLYRTGDLGRFRGDGLLEHHGRVDDMVKVRGCRVELGEVEAALCAHPGVSAAAVAPVRDALQETQLVACTVGVPGAAPPGPAELRAHLADRLPDYMVPIAFIPLVSLPRNANGKVDRAALPIEDWAAHRVRPPYRSPDGELERVICGLWTDLLSDDGDGAAGTPVGADDSFLDLGGTSLHAGRMVDRLRGAVRRAVSVQDVFLFPTPAGLARLLASRPEEAADAIAVPRPVRRRPR